MYCFLEWYHQWCPGLWFLHIVPDKCSFLWFTWLVVPGAPDCSFDLHLWWWGMVCIFALFIREMSIEARSLPVFCCLLEEFFIYYRYWSSSVMVCKYIFLFYSLAFYSLNCFPPLLLISCHTKNQTYGWKMAFLSFKCHFSGGVDALAICESFWGVL